MLIFRKQAPEVFRGKRPCTLKKKIYPFVSWHLMHLRPVRIAEGFM